MSNLENKKEETKKLSQVIKEVIKKGNVEELKVMYRDLTYGISFLENPLSIKEKEKKEPRARTYEIKGVTPIEKFASSKTVCEKINEVLRRKDVSQMKSLHEFLLKESKTVEALLDRIVGNVRGRMQ